MAGVLKNYVNLVIEIISQIAVQFLDRFFVQAVDDASGVFRLHGSIQHIRRIDQHKRARCAWSQATHPANQHLLAGGFSLLHQLHL